MENNNNNRLTDAQFKAIELLTNGENKTDTGKLVGVTRQTIDNWLKNKEFKSAFDEYKAVMKNLANVEMNGHAKSLMDNLIKIALTGKSEKNRLDATIHGLNRIYGMPTSKIESVVDNKTDNINDNKSVDINDMINELDNVIDISKAQ